MLFPKHISDRQHENDKNKFDLKKNRPKPQILL